MSLKKEHVQLAMKYMQLLLPVAVERMPGSDFLQEVQNIEEKLGVLLRQMSTSRKNVGESLSPQGFKELKKHVRDLKAQLDLKVGAKVYPYLEGPTKQLLTQVEIIIKKIPY